MSTLEEVKAATVALKPEDQMELFHWWVQSDLFKTRQLAALKRLIATGLEQLDRGRYETYTDSNVMQLGEEVVQFGRERLKEPGRNSPA